MTSISHLNRVGSFEYVICTEALGASKRGAVDAEDRGRINNLICRGFRVIDLSSTAIFSVVLFSLRIVIKMGTVSMAS